MKYISVLLTASLALGVSANYNIFHTRQGNGAFVPGTTLVTSCAANEVECNDYCLDLAQGDSCCSEGYGCPGGSFCLTKGYCCPNELDPATCALNNGVTLSAGFNTQGVPPTPAATGTDTTLAGATATPAGSTNTNSNASVTTTTRPSSSVTQFEGGAGRVYGYVGAGIGAAAGVFAMLL